MSGICGTVGGPSTEKAKEIMSTMLDSMNHRGPDGRNFYANKESTVALGQVHLAAFGERLQSSSPGFGSSNGFVVAIDGGAVNRVGMGGDAGSHSLPEDLNKDVKSILSSYETYGDDFLSKLDGPFSLALWDQRRKRLVLSRDKLGEKTLYYYADSAGKTGIFGSEIKTILSHPLVTPELDWESLSLYLAFGYIPGPKTLFKNIFKLLPGESLNWQLSQPPERKKYWHLPPIVDGVNDEDFCIRQLHHLFMKGLESYVNGCQEIAVFLSGGVDSSIIVAGLRELGVPRIGTFTVGFKVDSENSQGCADLAYARLVAEKFGTEHHEVIIEPGHNPEAQMLHVIKQFDDLIMTPNTYSKSLLVKAVREAGFNSVLTGSAAAGACGVHRKFLDSEKRARLLKKTQRCATDEERYFTLRSRLFDLGQQKHLLRVPPSIEKQDILNVLHNYIGDIKSDDFFKLFLFSNLMITSTEKTLKVLDKIGMMQSVELRSPYLYRELVEFSTQLPSSFDNGKTYVSLKTHLKKAFEPTLPQSVLDRPVQGYPSYYWNNGELGEFQKRVFSREAIDRNGIFNYDGVMGILEEEKHSDAKSVGKHCWALTQFSLWYEIYIKKNQDLFQMVR